MNARDGIEPAVEVSSDWAAETDDVAGKGVLGAGGPATPEQPVAMIEAARTRTSDSRFTLAPLQSEIRPRGLSNVIRLSSAPCASRVRQPSARLLEAIVSDEAETTATSQKRRARRGFVRAQAHSRRRPSGAWAPMTRREMSVRAHGLAMAERRRPARRSVRGIGA